MPGGRGLPLLPPLPPRRGPGAPLHRAPPGLTPPPHLPPPGALHRDDPEAAQQDPGVAGPPPSVWIP